MAQETDDRLVDDRPLKEIGDQFSAADPQAETVEAPGDQTTPLHERHRSDRAGVLATDSEGHAEVVDPAFAGTLGGNTQAPDVLLREEPDPVNPEEDLGPQGTIVQKIGGEARY
ncbi:MAG: hypothetical protein ACK47B_26870 [Armatimonadota bacterium]